MKKIIFIVFLFVGVQTNAQQYIPFPTDSAQWSIRRNQGTPFSQTSFQYKMKGDTLINGIKYHKIYYSHDLAYNSPNQTLHCFLREDTTKKVFVKYPVGSGIDTTEFILYNFNLAVGDTVTIKLLYPSDSLFKLVVTNVDSSNFLTGYRKYIGLKTAGISMWGGSCDNDITWVDGMGGNGLFYNEFPQLACFGNYSYDMVCFWHKGVYVFGGTFCDYETGIDEIKNGNNQSYIFPDPLNDISFIEFAGKQYVNMEIYNVLGEKIKEINIKDKEKISLNKTDFSLGVFIYRLISQNGHYQIGKFVVQ